MIDVEYFLAGFWSLDWLWKKGKTGFVVAGVVVALLVYTVGKIMCREKTRSSIFAVGQKIIHFILLPSLCFKTMDGRNIFFNNNHHSLNNVG